MRETRVLIVDDSAVVRQGLSKALGAIDGIRVVGTASDAFAARDQVVKLEPDVITLDLKMPRMDGLSFLKKLMAAHPIPTIIVSSLTEGDCALAVECLAAGAIAVVPKPEGAIKFAETVDRLAAEVAGAVEVRMDRQLAKSSARPRRPAAAIAGRGHGIVAIGASTGGTKALREVLGSLPGNLPPITIVQHMPKGFTEAFANALDRESEPNVCEARDKMRLENGQVVIAPGGRQMRIKSDAQGYKVEIFDGPPVRRHRPSVEVMFRSVADAAGSDALGIILTGMGDDGGEGLLEMRRAGAHTIAQDEESCVVFGMPRVAIECGGACDVLPLDTIPDAIVQRSVRQAA